MQARAWLLACLLKHAAQQTFKLQISTTHPSTSALLVRACHHSEIPSARLGKLPDTNSLYFFFKASTAPHHTTLTWLITTTHHQTHTCIKYVWAQQPRFLYSTKQKQSTIVSRPGKPKPLNHLQLLLASSLYSWATSLKLSGSPACTAPHLPPQTEIPFSVRHPTLLEWRDHFTIYTPFHIKNRKTRSDSSPGNTFSPSFTFTRNEEAWLLVSCQNHPVQNKPKAK